MTAADRADRRAADIVLAEARRAYTAWDPDATMVCGHCGAVVNPADGDHAAGVFLCEACLRHPRFDLDRCPDCAGEWADVMSPCPGCGLTVEVVADRHAARRAGR